LPPGGGFGGCPPTKPKKGRVAHLSNPATGGTHNAGEPSAYEGGQNGGSRGAKPPWQGVWGMCPHKTKKGASSPH